jgi:hypothetical protein
MSYLDIAKRAQARLKAQKDPPVWEATADPTEGRVIAYLIASEVLGADIWLALDDSFEADDKLAVFYPDELPFLATKDGETLKEIHKYKLAFPGARVRT